MSEALTFQAFDDREEASGALAAELVAVLQAALVDKGQASLVISGGSSPVQMFRVLGAEPLPWEHVTIVPSDEREVPLDHADRNETMIRRELMYGPAADARLVSLFPPGAIPPRFDAVVLGMGSDGHTASLFPGSPELAATLAESGPLARLEVPQLGMHRVSMTPAALLETERLFLLFFGDEKRDVFDRARAAGPVAEYPVRAVLHQGRVDVEVYWAP
jgi:6-phosphogluconolactonase